MGKTLAKNVLTVPEACSSKKQFGIEVQEILTTHVLEFTAFEQIPHALLRVEFGRVGRQMLQVNARSSPLRQEIFDVLTVMNRGPVPDDEQLPWDLCLQLLEKAHNIRSLVRVILYVHEQTSLWSQRPNRREMVSCQRKTQDRCFAPRSVSAHGHRQQVKPRLVYKDNLSPLLLGFFLRRGQCSSFHILIASSFLWVALLTGFCTLCLMARRRRLQWEG